MRGPPGPMVLLPKPRGARVRVNLAPPLPDAHSWSRARSGLVELRAKSREQRAQKSKES